MSDWTKRGLCERNGFHWCTDARRLSPKAFRLIRVYAYSVFTYHYTESDGFIYTVVDILNIKLCSDGIDFFHITGSHVFQVPSYLQRSPGLPCQLHQPEPSYPLTAP